MVTERARQLSKEADQELSKTTLLIAELRLNCKPTLAEFLELYGRFVYKPEMFYEINFGSKKVQELVQKMYD